jgi:hypothetical protein
VWFTSPRAFVTGADLGGARRLEPPSILAPMEVPQSFPTNFKEEKEGTREF